MPDRSHLPSRRLYPVLSRALPMLLAVLLVMVSSALGAVASGAGPGTVARQGDPGSGAATPTTSLAERWAIPDGLPAAPETTAQAIFAGDVQSGQVLFASHADDERAPASTAKVAISLTLVDILTNLDQVVTIEQDDTVDITVFSNAQLETNDEVTVESLLYGLMLPSGNDAARALARVAGQTLDPNSDDPTATFLDAVNARAAELGATNTMILNPAGEDTDGQHTTARDLAILAAALLDNELLATIVASENYPMPVDGPDARTVNLTNTNQLLGEDGIIGVKTGSTPDAGACLVTGAQFSSSSRVVIVVLGSDLQYDADDRVVDGSDRRYDDSLAIIRAIPQEYSWIDLNNDDAIDGLAAEAAAWQVGFQPDAEIVVQKDRVKDVSYRMILGPMGQAGDAVGRVLFFIGDKQIADQPVYQL